MNGYGMWQQGGSDPAVSQGACRVVLMLRREFLDTASGATVEIIFRRRLEAVQRRLTRATVLISLNFYKI